MKLITIIDNQVWKYDSGDQGLVHQHSPATLQVNLFYFENCHDLLHD